MTRRLVLLRALLVVTFLAVACFYAVTSIHWPMMSDSPIMHYVNFLMRHGMKPYVDITDNNMPGSYLAEAAAMKVFGPGDLGWRVYEFSLLALLTGALIVIARPYDWLAGFYAGGLFLLAHAADGPNYAAEREQVLTLLLMISYACLFVAVRRRWPALMLAFGLCSAFAGSIKPTMSPLALALLFLAGAILWKRRVPVRPYMLFGLLGMTIVAAADLAFLAHYGAIRPFLFVLHTVTPAYVSLNHPRWSDMLLGAFPLTMVLLLPFAAVAGVLSREWNWERWALAMGAAFGLFSYFAQQKGFVHHRYMFMTCVFLLLCLELMSGLRQGGLARASAVAGIALTVAFIVPRYVEVYRRQPVQSEFAAQLQTDLQSLGGQRLQSQVQCFDLVYGCLNALYHLQLVENTGFTGDLLFFVPNESPARTHYRDMFWALARKDPANVMVVSNEWFGMPNSFAKVNTWPEFAAYLKSNYTQVIERSFPEEVGISRGRSRSAEADAYRIYIRNGSSLTNGTAKPTP